MKQFLVGAALGILISSSTATAQYMDSNWMISVMDDIRVLRIALIDVATKYNGMVPEHNQMMSDVEALKKRVSYLENR